MDLRFHLLFGAFAVLVLLMSEAIGAYLVFALPHHHVLGSVMVAQKAYSFVFVMAYFEFAVEFRFACIAGSFGRLV